MKAIHQSIFDKDDKSDEMEIKRLDMVPQGFRSILSFVKNHF